MWSEHGGPAITTSEFQSAEMNEDDSNLEKSDQRGTPGCISPNAKARLGEESKYVTGVRARDDQAYEAWPTPPKYSEYVTRLAWLSRTGDVGADGAQSGQGGLIVMSKE